MEDMEEAKTRARKIVATTDISAAELLAYLALKAEEADPKEIIEARDEVGLDINNIGPNGGRLKRRVEEAMEEIDE
jgi:hypothetical protein